ncbi:hypothetical protein [Butyricimonas paravirosa]|uniref:hypothetical protein n=1 Tax=Butyricimonas paravirosa TaxID=1472417 RepID=UPI002A83DDF8|nr:hypothetical protein [Butyricimonas paravirosa]
MKRFLVVCCMVYSLFSCGSKKEFTKVDSVENITSTEQLYAELYRTARLLEFLDIKYRKVETRDSSGNVRIEMEAGISKKTEANEQDTTKITGTRQEAGEKVVNHDEGEERSGVMEYWVWITGFVAVIIIALVVGIYVVKR